MNKKIWFTSDLHFSQKNIITNLSKWNTNKQLRNFDSIQHMNETIVNNINKYVDKKDDLYILGDFSFDRDLKSILYWLKQINCINIHFILGNHDYKIIKWSDTFINYFKCIVAYKELTHRYPLEGTNPDVDKWEGSQKICMSHYGMRVWNGSHKGSWMLYGHSHDSLDNPAYREPKTAHLGEFYAEQKTMDVGIDSAFRILGEYRPFEFNEIKEIMDNRDIIKIDHH